MLVVSDDKGLSWRCLDELRPGEYVATQYGSNLWSALPARFDDFHPSPRLPSQTAVWIPTEMTAGLAFLLGAYAAGGCTAGDSRIVITNSQPVVRHRVASTWRSVFGIEPGSEQPDSSYPQVFAHSKVIRDFFEYLGCGRHPSRMRIPDAILRSPRDMVLAFLQGLTLDADVAKIDETPTWVVCLDSSGLVDDLQAVLTNLGVVHNRTSDEVRVVGAQARRLTQLVPFMEPAKATRARSLLLTAPARRTADVVPGISSHELNRLIPCGEGHHAAPALLGTPHVSWEMLDRVSQIPGVELPEWLQRVLVDNLHFSRVESVSDEGER
ncbi:MAG: hypothetical protein ACRDTT_35250, partial [Pseudonocardiaceae bacterium]